MKRYSWAWWKFMYEDEEVKLLLLSNVWSMIFLAAMVLMFYGYKISSYVVSYGVHLPFSLYLGMQLGKYLRRKKTNA
jgi:hypothetical protein